MSYPESQREENEEFEGTAEDMELYSLRKQAELEWELEALFDSEPID